MDTGIAEVATPTSPPSPPADSKENKKRRKKKSGSKEESPSKKDKKGKKDKSARKDRDDKDVVDIDVSPSDKHSKAKGRDSFGGASRLEGRDAAQEIESMMTENIGVFEKSSTLPSSPGSPTDSVFEDSASPSKRERTKSRSRSGSRSRFSGLFKRKKQRSRSETDVSGKNLGIEDDTELRSEEKVLDERQRSRRAKSATSSRAGAATDTEQTGYVSAAGTFPRKANLKRESPHHAYDSKVQPRDRLLNMTVRDAAKEKRLRQVESPRRSRLVELAPGQDYAMPGRYSGDGTYPIYPEQFTAFPSSMGLSREKSPTGADYQRTSAVVHNSLSSPEDSTRSSTLPRTLRSKSSSQAPFGYEAGASEISNNVETLDAFTIPRNVSTPVFVHPGTGLSQDNLNVSQEIRMLGQNQIGNLESHANLSTQKVRTAEDDLKASGPTESDRENSPSDQRRHEAGRREDTKPEAGSGERNKRKASLSKFLELRQAIPSGLGLTRRTSQSSDSGVTSRDTSPSASIIRRQTRKDRDTGNCELQAAQSSTSGATSSELQRPRPSQLALNSGAKNGRRVSNPYVVSSVIIPDSNVLPAPRLYLNGTNLEASDDPKLQAQTGQPPSRQSNPSSNESSFICPSPNTENSQSSSYRSSDQGFVGSETSDADVEDTADDDNSDFSTPPEEVEPFSPTEEDPEASMRFATPRVLEKLLADTQKQIRQGRTFFPSDNRDVPVNRVSSGHSRYVPHGVRRCHSDIENTGRATSPRRTFRQGPSFSDSAKETTALSESLETLRELPCSAQLEPNSALPHDKRALDEDRLSAASTSTLTNIDSIGPHPSEPVSDSQLVHDGAEHKNVPRLSLAAQQKYRRTFSPSRIRKTLVPTPEEDSTGPSYTPSVVSLPPPPTSKTAPQVPVKSTSSLVSTIPAPSSAPKYVYAPQSVSPSPKQTVSTHQENQGGAKPIDNNIILTSDRTLDSAVIPSQSAKPNTSGNSPFVERLEASRTPQTVVKASSVLVGRGVSVPAEASGDLPSADVQVDNSSNVPSVERQMSAPAAEQSSKTASSHDAVPTAQPDKLIARQSAPVSPTAFFPIIHGLELASDKAPKFKGESLSDFLQQQSKANWRRLGSPTKDKPEAQSKKDKPESPTKKSPKKETKKSKQKQTKAEEKSVQKQTGITLNEERGTSPVVESRAVVERQISSHEKSPLLQMSKVDREAGMRIMVDKECQTSSWLINTLVKSSKSNKPKKKASSFTKSTKTKKQRRRRDSSASDTFIPENRENLNVNLTRQRRNATQWSSLGDVRVVAALEEESERKLKRTKSDRASRRSIDDDMGTDSSNPGRSRVHSDDSDPPKPKKLSLTAIILLKNRLAKFKEKKGKERESFDVPAEEDQVESDVPSDTMMTIENEINLSKLEVSKETDIVDDDIFEPDFSLDFSKRSIRFDEMPPNEPMQSEEPLPPLPPPTSRRMRQRRESTMRERRRKCVSYCKKFIAFLFSHIGLCSLVVAYTIMGGFIFQFLENDKDLDVRKTITERRSDVIGHLISLAVDFQETETGMQNLTREVEQSVQDYQRFIYRKVKNEGWDGQDEGLWTFASSMLYAITVTTTIGYGHVAPKTSIGRLVTIGYAVVGIPLTLLCLTNIGDVMATGFRLLYGKVCCGVCCTLFKPRRRTLTLHPDLEKGMGIGRPVVTSNEDESPDKSKEVIHVPTSLCLLLIAGYIIAGAMLFASWENWDMLTGSYFCFITLSTIGFGDIVPGMDSGAWAQEEKLVLCALYLVLGLSLIAMCFNLVQEDVKAKCKWLGMKLGIVEKPKAPL